MHAGMERTHKQECTHRLLLKPWRCLCPLRGIKSIMAEVITNCGGGANAGQYHIVCCQKLVDEPMHLMGRVRYSWGWDLSSCRCALFFMNHHQNAQTWWCVFEGKQILPCEHLKSFFYFILKNTSIFLLKVFSEFCLSFSFPFLAFQG